MPFFMTEDNVKIYFEDKGKGRPVVLIHGLNCNRRFWKHQRPDLLKRHRVIAYDLRGHGDSDRPAHGLNLGKCAEDLHDLLDYLDVADAALVGWSLGAHVIFEYVARFGCEAFQKICLIDMTPKLICDGDWKLGLNHGAFSHADNLLALSIMCENWEAHENIVMGRLYAASGYENEEEKEWVRKELRKNSPHAIMNFWISMAVKDYRPVLPKIKVPCLIAFGEESQLYSRENSDYMASVIPRAEVVPFPKCGHAIPMEDPARFNDALVRFLG